MPMNHRLLVPRKVPGLLDLVPGAAAAYSLRSLSNSYAGPAVTVRRSSDDAEDSFTASEVADGTLAAFCGAGDGFVKTWHSQTGSNDATQTTAGYQPKIVSSGVVILEEGKPAIQFDGSDDYLQVASSTATFKFLHSAKSSLFAVFSIGFSANPSALMWVFGTGGGASSNVGFALYYNDLSDNNRLGVYVDRGVSGTNAASAFKTNAISPQSQSMFSGIFDIASAVASERAIGYIDSASLNFANTSTLAPSTSNSSGDFSIGFFSTASNYFFGGLMQEIVIYPSDLTEQRELVEGLIAWGYSI